MSAPRRGFASDNYAGALPEVLQAVAAANGGHARAYGADEWTARARELFREHFGAEAQAFTVYSPAEIQALADQAHAEGMLLRVDGARLANAGAALEVPLRALTTDAGVDLLSFGGTKCGAICAEALVVLRPGLGEGVEYLRKQSMQLASKMRFLSVQLAALLTDDLWRRTAAHANAMARRLAERVEDAVTITQPVESNAVFAILTPEATARLQRDWPFYVWNETTGEVRWMCSWDTTEEDVDAFAAAVRATR